MSVPRSSLTALALLAVLATSGCSGGSGNAATSPPMSRPTTSPAGSPAAGAATTPAAATPVIVIKDFEYQVPDSVPAGTTITVRNDDSEAHTVTSDEGGAFDVTIRAGGTATFPAPAKAGDFPFHCTYHADMHGTLTVG